MAGYRERYLQWTNGNEEAAELIGLFGALQHIADDFIDEDIEGGMKARSDAMTRLLFLALVKIPHNEFFQQHYTWLSPIINTVLVQVNCADHWYTDAQQEKQLYSYVWRTSAEQLIHQIAFLCGSLEHAQDVARDYRKVWLETDDDHSYDLWKKEHE